MKIPFRVLLLASLCLVCATSRLAAQRGGSGRAGRGVVGIGNSAPSPTSGASFDPAQVARGEKTFGEKCASCHRANARGGTGKGIAEVDLLRSPMVLDDLGGREIGEFLKFGRPEKNMPKFDLTTQENSDIAAFLHRQITAASERGTYVRLNVLSGDPKAGEAFFNGPVGKCNTCHSATGDMKGLAAKSNNDASTIQGLIVGGGAAGGRGGRGRGGAAVADPAATPTPSKTATTATVTTKSGETFTGLPVQVTDFVVVIQPSSGPIKSFVRQGDWPKVALHNPLQAHVDLLPKYTDADIHNLAAYLVSLK
jgi:cytochrome c oxidase cbb3-type subunit 3